MNIPERIEALRHWMLEHRLDAFIVTGTDPHESEYLAARWQSRCFLSGFTGSAGTLVFTRKKASLWTDGRYFLQAENELNETGVDLQREGVSGTPSVVAWLKRELTPGSKIGVDAATTNWARLSKWSDEFRDASIVLEATSDPLTELWNDRPAPPLSKIWDYQSLVSLEERREKLAKVRKGIKAVGASAHLVTTLDDIAWILNLRAADIAYNPVFLSWLLIEENRATLFVEASRLEESALTALKDEGVGISPYEKITEILEDWNSSQKLLLAPEKVNSALVSSLADRSCVIWGNSPSTLLKAVKSKQEIDLIREALIKDGTALVEFLCWFERKVPEGNLTERTAAQALEDFRKKQTGYRGPSFAPIAGFLSNGAIIHYDVGQNDGAPLKGRGLFLLDTGAQYLEGTTDVTRTLLLGKPTPEEMTDYTLVLKAHIQLALTPFPKGTRGFHIDAFARRVLWRHHRNYNHGTGHGVGHFLCVHEPPQRLNTEPIPTILEPGMILSNEPGLYRQGQYGIRLENLVLAVSEEKNEFAEFLTWETLTLCPFEAQLIDPALLDRDEIEWLNSYHCEVFKILASHLTSDTAKWLEAKVKPLSL